MQVLQTAIMEIILNCKWQCWYCFINLAFLPDFISSSGKFTSTKSNRHQVRTTWSGQCLPWLFATNEGKRKVKTKGQKNCYWNHIREAKMMERCHQEVHNPVVLVVVPAHQHMEIKMVNVVYFIVLDLSIHDLITYKIHIINWKIWFLGIESVDDLDGISVHYGDECFYDKVSLLHFVIFFLLGGLTVLIVGLVQLKKEASLNFFK